MRAADIAAGALLAVLGLVTLFVFIPAEVGGSVDHGVAPDVFPRVLMWLVTLLAGLLVATRLPGRAPEDEAAPLTVQNFVYIVAASLVLLGAFFAVQQLGFILGGAITVGLAMLAMDGLRRPVRLAATVLLAPAAVYFVFKHLFAVYLP